MVDGSVPDLETEGRTEDGLGCDWRGSSVRLVGTCVLEDVKFSELGVGVCWGI
jgi:hypothetical protein